MYHPIPLKPGDTVALTAPSSPVPEINLKAAISSIELLGLKPVVMKSCRLSHGYLAGSDSQRAQDLNRAFSDPEIKGIFCLRGGYGTMRILPLLDLERIRQNPKIFVGYSDITALHTVFNQQCGFLTFHGPMPNTDYRKLEAFTMDSLKRCLFSTDYGVPADTLTTASPIRFCSSQSKNAESRGAVQNAAGDTAYHLSNPAAEPFQTLVPGTASGQLTGGNLSLIAGTLGSPYEIDTRGKILFLEDVGERPYRLDKSLTALSLAGKFRDCSGIVLGGFTECEEPDHDTAPPNSNIADSTLSLTQIIEEVILPWNKPTIANLQAGHLYPQSTLPLGATIQLCAAI